jgi:hypothetical protein
MKETPGRIATLLALAISAVAVGANGAYAAPSTPAGTGDTVQASGALTPGIASPRPLVSGAKPVAPIAIRYDFSTQPMLGTPFDVRISVQGGQGIADVSLAVQAGDGIQAGTPQLTASSANGVERTWTVAVTAFAEGTLHLNVFAQGTAGDQHPGRNLLIPIRIGTAVLAKPTTAPRSTTDPSGRGVIVLPADGAR